MGKISTPSHFQSDQEKVSSCNGKYNSVDDSTTQQNCIPIIDTVIENHFYNIAGKFGQKWKEGEKSQAIFMCIAKSGNVKKILSIPMIVATQGDINGVVKQRRIVRNNKFVW